MANPLRWFRRHQKLMMVVFGVGLMVVFGLGSVVMMVNPGDLARGAVEDKVIAEWSGGKITRSDLDNLRILHFRTIEFLQGLQQAAQNQKGDEFRSAAMMITPIITPGVEFQQELVDEELIRRFLLAQKAARDGLVVSEKMANEYLALVAGSAEFSPNDHKTINAEVNMGQISMKAVREHLRLELAAQQMDLFSYAGFPFYPNPSEAMQINEKMTREVDCQVYAVSISDFEDKTGEPDDSELEPIYEAGKFDYPDPRGIEPGFKQGQKINVEYLVADFETFLQNEINKLVGEEGDKAVKAYYEQMVENENSLVMEVIPDDPPTVPPSSESGDDPPTPRLNQGDSESSSAGDPPTPNPASSSESEPSASDSDNQSSGGTPPDQSDDAADGDQALVVGENRLQFVSFQETDETGSDEQGEKQGEQAETETDTAQQAGTTQESENQNTDSDSAPAAEPESETTGAQDPDMVQVPEIKDEPQIKRRPKPLKDVVEIVKREMKRKDATDAVQRALTIAEGEIRTYTALFGSWNSMIETERGEKPEPPDMKAIADKHNLQFVKVGLVDEVEFGDDALGKVIMFIPPRTTTNVAEFLFDRFTNLNLWDPIPANDIMSGANYLYWATETVEAKIPSFDEARGEVVEFWKKQKAIELATAEADKIAAELNSSSGRSLVELYPAKAVPTGSFRWFTSNFGAPRISSPTGVNGVSEEFMQTAFSLSLNQAGTAPNFLRDTVYVVQQIGSAGDSEEMGARFLEDKFFKFREMPADIQSVSQLNNSQLRDNWRLEFEKSLGLRFVGY